MSTVQQPADLDEVRCKAWDAGCNWAIDQLPASSPWPDAWNHDGNPHRATVKAAA